MGSIRRPNSFPKNYWSPRHAVVVTRNHGVTGGSSVDVIVIVGRWRRLGGSEKCDVWVGGEGEEHAGIMIGVGLRRA